MATKRKLGAMSPEAETPTDPADELMFVCLGGGNEVGRSCHIIQYKGKTVMVRAAFDSRSSWSSADGTSRPSLMLECIPHSMVYLRFHTTMTLT